MLKRRKIIAIICMACVALIFTLKIYYPELKLLIKKPTEIRAADENLNTKEPEIGRAHV